MTASSLQDEGFFYHFINFATHVNLHGKGWRVEDQVRTGLCSLRLAWVSHCSGMQIHDTTLIQDALSEGAAPRVTDSKAPLNAVV
jgi:hypothetical protein